MSEDVQIALILAGMVVIGFLATVVAGTVVTIFGCVP